MKKIFEKPHIWGFTTYFAEGFPYAFIRMVSPVFFRDMKVSLESIGLTSLFGIPWIVKFLWGPYLDSFATKRKWMLWMQIILAIIMLSTAFIYKVPGGIMVMAILLLIGSFFAATNDIAIDGYYMEALDSQGQAKFVGYRVMAYRLAMMTGTGIVVTVGTTAGWFYAFVLSSVLLGLLMLYHFFFLPQAEKEKKPLRELFKSFLTFKKGGWALLLCGSIALLYYGTQTPAYKGLGKAIPALGKLTFSAWISIILLLTLVVIALLRKKIGALLTKNPDSFYSKAFVTFMEQDKIGILLTFVILVRAGEFMLSTMASSFMVDLGIKVHYGWISGGVGLTCSIIGAMLGGWLIAKYSLKKTLWPFLLAQNFTNIVYMLLALYLSHFVSINTGVQTPTPIGTVNLVLVACMSAFDQFSGGLGTSVLMTFLMRLCLKEYKAAHYAIGSGLMSISGVFVGVFSGFIAASIGYAYFFGVSFLVSIPGMLVVFWLPESFRDTGSKSIPQKA
ncbi:MAG: MFS transporter [Chitinivibrionales bacterium]|nr:MFS transporter [Chitinivibrionales bacterium]